MPLQKTFCSCGFAIPRQQGWLQYLVPLDSVASPRHTARPEATPKFVVLAQKENGDNIQLDMDEANSHWHLSGATRIPKARAWNVQISIFRTLPESLTSKNFQRGKRKVAIVHGLQPCPRDLQALECPLGFQQLLATHFRLVPAPNIFAFLPGTAHSRLHGHL